MLLLFSIGYVPVADVNTFDVTGFSQLFLVQDKQYYTKYRMLMNKYDVKLMVFSIILWSAGKIAGFYCQRLEKGLKQLNKFLA